MHQTNCAQPIDDRAPVDASIEDLDPEAVSSFLRRLRSEGRAALDDQPSDTEALERMVVMDDGRPTLAGLLVFGRYPQKWFPQLAATVAVFPTGDGTEIRNGLRLLDNRTVDGAAPRIVARTVEAIARNLGHRVLSAGMGGQQEWEIPEGVLREAITNAIMHRDYSPFSLGSQVRVEVYPDRVEVHSPGGVWGGQSIDDLLRGGSHSRNAVLANLLADAQLRGSHESVAENKGTGLRRMVGLMRNAGLPNPEFIDSVSEFVVVLRRVANATSGQINLEHASPVCDIVMDALRRAGSPVRAADMVGTDGISRRQVDRALTVLLDQGRIEPTAVPRSKNRAYRIVALAA